MSVRTHTPSVDHGFKETMEKYNGQWLDGSEITDLVSTVGTDHELTKIYKPVSTLGEEPPLLACIVKGVYKGEVLEELRETVQSIEDVSTLRANAAGPIDKEEMAKKGMIEGVHYKLRTANSYYPLKKDGTFNRIAEANPIHSIFMGYKRGRFTGMIGLSGWSKLKRNQEKWESMQRIATLNEIALKKGAPEVWKKQRDFCDTSVEEKYWLNGAPFTSISANKYSYVEGAGKMSAHVDGDDLDFGMTTMCVFRCGDYDGAYLSFPRYGIGIDADDGDVIIADSNELHGVTQIKGEGVRHTCVAYCGSDVATKGVRGKTENPIGHHHRDKHGSLDEFIS